MGRGIQSHCSRIELNYLYSLYYIQYVLPVLNILLKSDELKWELRSSSRIVKCIYSLPITKSVRIFREAEFWMNDMEIDNDKQFEI